MKEEVKNKLTKIKPTRFELKKWNRKSTRKKNKNEIRIF